MNKKLLFQSSIISLSLLFLIYVFSSVSLEIFIAFPFLTIFIYFFTNFLKNFARNVTIKDDTLLAWEYVKKYWENFREEKLLTLNAKAKVAYFGDGEDYKYIAFSLFRAVNKKEGGEKPGCPLVIIVRATRPFQVVAWDDNPTAEIQRDPFLLLSEYYVGSPSPRVSIESSLLPIKKPFMKEEKPKEEKKEEELFSYTIPESQYEIEE